MRGVMVRLNIFTLPPCISDIGGNFDRNANVGYRTISKLIPLALLDIPRRPWLQLSLFKIERVDIWLYNRCRMVQRRSNRTICSGAASLL